MAPEDFNDIFLRMHDRLYRVASGIVGSRSEAGDLVQELYERLWRRRAMVEGLARPEGYILTSARNLCLDRLRSRRPQAELSPTMATESDRPGEGDVAEIVARLMAELPEGQRTVMRLRDVECMEVDEIAAVTGLRPTAVRMTLSRARTSVKEKLVKILNHGL
jgi:RNA polymerase sigma-70 factor (ECF subfamily)